MLFSCLILNKQPWGNGLGPIHPRKIKEGSISLWKKEKIFQKAHSCIGGQETGVSAFATSKNKIAGVSSLGESLCLVFLATKQLRSSKAWTLAIVSRKARSRIFHKCVTCACLFPGQATQDGYSLALCAPPASVWGPSPCAHYRPPYMLAAGPSW